MEVRLTEIQDFEENTHADLVETIHHFLHEMFMTDDDVISVTINHADGVWYGTVTYLVAPEPIPDEDHADLCSDCREKALAREAAEADSRIENEGILT